MNTSPETDHSSLTQSFRAKRSLVLTLCALGVVIYLAVKLYVQLADDAKVTREASSLKRDLDRSFNSSLQPWNARLFFELKTEEDRRRASVCRAIAKRGMHAAEMGDFERAADLLVAVEIYWATGEYPPGFQLLDPTD